MILYVIEGSINFVFSKIDVGILYNVYKNEVLFQTTTQFNIICSYFTQIFRKILMI